MICPRHRTYKAINQPKVDCLPCWLMYERALANRFIEAVEKIKELEANESHNCGKKDKGVGS